MHVRFLASLTPGGRVSFPSWARGLALWLGVFLLAGLAQAQTPPAPSPTPQPAPKAQPKPLELCAVLFDAGRMEAALKACERAVQNNPTTESLYLLARTQAELQLFTPAVDNLRQSIKLNATFVQSYVALAQIYTKQYLLADNRDNARGMLDQALSTLKEAERANAKYAPLYATRGLVYAYQNKFDLAIDSLNKSLALKDDPLVRASMADVYLRQGKVDEALKNYDDAVKASPNSALLRVKYGSLLLVRGDVDAAVSHLDQAVQLSPGNAEAWLRRGDAYSEKKDWKQAGVSYEQTVALAPVRYPDAYMGLGQVLLELKDYQKAKYNFTKAVALEKDNAPYRYWLGHANELLGDKVGAKTQCDEALRLKPDFKEAQDCSSRNK